MFAQAAPECGGTGPPGPLSQELWAPGQEGVGPSLAVGPGPGGGQAPGRCRGAARGTQTQGGLRGARLHLELGSPRLGTVISSLVPPPTQPLLAMTRLISRGLDTILGHEPPVPPSHLSLDPHWSHSENGTAIHTPRSLTPHPAGRLLTPHTQPRGDPSVIPQNVPQIHPSSWSL